MAGTRHRLLAPRDAFGVVTERLVAHGATVDYASALVQLDPNAVGLGAGDSRDDAGGASDGQRGDVFATPLGGRYYARPAPDAEPFIKVGDRIAEGATVALIEVMKTFNRVTYDGPPARVRAFLAEDGQDVEASDALFELEAET